MRIALQRNLTLPDDDIVAILKSSCARVGYPDAAIVSFDNGIDLEEIAACSGDALLDLVITPYELGDYTAVQALEEIRTRLPLVYSIIVADTSDHAPEAAEHLVDGYLMAPIDAGDFAKTLEHVLVSIQRLHDASFVMTTSIGEVRLPFHSVRYCETIGHDQVIHLEDGTVVQGRYSSQALYDLLAADGLFFKVGCSFIVNLNEVNEADIAQGTLTLADGTRLGVPLRLRKDLGRTLLQI